MIEQIMQYVLTADWQGQSATSAASRDIDGVNKNAASSADKAKKRMIAWGAGALAAAASVQTLKKGLEALEQGAALIETNRKFENFTESIGLSADVIEGRLHDAMGLLMSDQEQVALATQLMSLNLVKNEKDLIRLASVVAELNIPMDQLVLSITNQTTARFDQMGLAVEGFKEKMKSLEATGMSSSDAYMEAFLSGAEGQLERQGGSVQGLARKILELKNIAKNAGDQFKISFAEGATRAFDDANISVGDLERGMIEMAVNAGDQMGNLLGQIVAVGKGLADIANALETGDWDLDWKAILARGISMGGGGGLFNANQDPITQIGNSLAQAIVNAVQGPQVDSGLPNIHELLTAFPGQRTAILAGLSLQERVTFGEYASTMTPDARATEAEGYRLLEREEQLPQIYDPDQLADDWDSLGEGVSGYAAKINNADEAMRALAASTGSFFDQARRGMDVEFDSAEYFYEQLIKKGASAVQARDFLIASELETPEDAQAIFERGRQQAMGENLAAFGVAENKIGQAWSMFQAGMENPLLAEQLGGGTVVENGVVVNVTFSGGVMDPEMVLELFDDWAKKYLDEVGALVGGGGG